MRFLTTDAQIKAANSAVTVDLSIQAINSYGEDIENELVSILGEETIIQIESNTSALANFRRAIIELTLASYASSGAILISNSGIHVTKSNTLLPASDKKLIMFRTDATTRGWRAFEQLITSMEANLFLYSSWRDSEQRKSYFSTLFRDSGEFSSFGGLAITPSLFRVLKPMIIRVQEDVLYREFGEALIDDVITKRLLGTLSVQEKKLERKLMRVLAPFSLQEAIPYQMVQILEGGVYTASIAALSSGSDNVQAFTPADQKRLRSLMVRLESEGESKQLTTLKWLQQHAVDFPLFGGSDREIYPMTKLNDSDSNVYFM